MRVHNILFCRFKFLCLQFQVALQQSKTKSLKEFSEGVSYILLCIKYVLPFESAFECFEDVAMYFSCIRLFWCYSSLRCRLVKDGY